MRSGADVDPCCRKRGKTYNNTASHMFAVMLFDLQSCGTARGGDVHWYMWYYLGVLEAILQILLCLQSIN